MPTALDTVEDAVRRRGVELVELSRAIHAGGATVHQPGFAAAAVGPSADRAVTVLEAKQRRHARAET